MLFVRALCLIFAIAQVLLELIEIPEIAYRENIVQGWIIF